MVRVCDVTYDKAPLEKDGITVVVRASGLWRHRCWGVGGVGGVGGPALGVWGSLAGAFLPVACPLPAPHVGARAVRCLGTCLEGLGLSLASGAREAGARAGCTAVAPGAGSPQCGVCQARTGAPGALPG